jgi:outer membrane protein assembly factor BamA
VRRLLAIGLVTLAAAPAAAQRYWKDTLYPFGYYTTIDDFWFGGHYAWFSPMTDIDRPERYHASVSGDASFSTEGSFRLLALADFPAWWDGWRASLAVAGARANRLGYFGLGNDTPYSRDSVRSGARYFYAVSRTTQQVRATVQRRVVGRLRLLAGGAYEHTSYRALPGANVFRTDLTAGTVDSAQLDISDVAAQVGLVFDTRDNELDPHRGLIVEALLGWGDGYRRQTAQARGFVQPFERLTVAARAAVETMSGDPPLAPLTEMASSERPFVTLGGYYSLRGYYDGRFAAPGKLLGGLEARYALIWAPSVFEVKLVGFYDVGRVFGPGEEVTLTTRGLHQGAGGEVAARFGRNTLIVLGMGFGDEGSQFLFGTTWSY